MPNVKDFYPGATAGNPINNATDAVDSTNAIFSTSAVQVDDQNSVANALIWTGTTAEYAALGSYDANTLYFVT
jgi:hypothetical protein